MAQQTGSPWFLWERWRRKVLRYIKKGDLETAACLLSMSLEDPQGPSDVRGQRRMFTSQALVPHHKELLKFLIPEITPEFQVEVYENLRWWGWDI